ncbi:transporter, small conductance mechanosensitive ion channel MscS family protein [Leptotrichia wadei]|uniref:Transporter, small conductance mechanosensitive ion channel MscS family protein n=1 Tax=Leptotrichia wadei TaxID=157687 RepID=A0A133ZWS8_9FUSO|nr:mechanosensitive ion channel family protein [Leptotrichia wadei]KXB59877.1 transporter, small conductance mechanosensitive ion channel MscS family protein [Leptotrichia wadei]
MKELEKFLELDNIIRFLKTNIFKLFIIFLIVKIGKIFKTRIEKILKIILDKSNIDKSVASFLLSIYSILYYFILIYSSVGILGINTTSITTFLGATGIVLGIAFKETLGNFCGGLIILTFKPFSVGDTIEYNNYIGTVTKIELFYTKMLNPQNELVIIPNGIVTNTEIRNIRQNGERRLDLEVGVSYNSDIQKVKGTLERIIKEETMNEVEETQIKNNLLVKLQNTILEKREKSKINLFATIFSRKKMKEAEDEANKKTEEENYESDKNTQSISNTSKVVNDDKKMILASKPSIIGVGQLADSAIIFYVYVYTRSENYLDLKMKLNEKIKMEFDKLGIEIPYPRMDVHIQNNK